VRRTLRLPPVLMLPLAQSMPDIPLQAYNLCIYSRSAHLELAYMALSLSFGNLFPSYSQGLPSQLARTLHLDAMMFFVIVFVSIRTGISLPGGQPSILRTIVKDSTIYFLVIFSSHLLSLVMLLVTRVSTAAFSL
jgi:hypothetical protein